MAMHTRRDYPWRRSHRRLLMLLLGFAGMVALVMTGLHWRGESAFQKRLAVIRAKGEPLTPTELKIHYPAPAKEENADETYGEAGKTLQNDFKNQTYRDSLAKINETPLKQGFTDELHQWMEGYLTEHAEALRILHEAAKKPAARYDLELNRGFEAPIPNLLQLRSSANLLQLEAYVAAKNGDSAGVTDAIVAALAMDRSMRTVPFIIMAMIRAACQSIACNTLKRVLPAVAFSGEQLAQMQQALAKTSDPTAMTDAFICERAMGLQAFDHPQQIFPEIRNADNWVPGASALAAGFIRMSTAANGDRERYLQIMTELVDVSRLPPYEGLPILEKMGQEQDAQRSFLPSLTDRIIPNLYRSEIQYTRSEACLRCAQAAIAAERYRLANGRTPGSLGDLTPAFLAVAPSDPFDGQLLRYRIDGQNYTFYSIGENRIDDQGKDPPKGASDDIVLQVGRSM